jgi:hypothetical protein
VGPAADAPGHEVAPAPQAEPPDPPPPSPYSPISPDVREAASVEPMPAKVTLTRLDRPEPAPKVETPPPPPAPPDAPLVSALTATLKEHPEEALRVLDKYDQSDRELLLALIRLAAGIDRKDLERLSADEVAGTLERLRLVTAQLRQRAPLSLDKVCFCKTIEGFGQYQPRPRGQEFRAGSDGRPGERVQVYVEVRNFGSVAKQEQYETRLSSSLSILDEDRREVATMTPETSVDHSQTPRQDYFLNFQFHVPAKLKPGLYTLWVTVKDVTPPAEGANKTVRVARRSLDFRVCPPGAPADRP